MQFSWRDRVAIALPPAGPRVKLYVTHHRARTEIPGKSGWVIADPFCAYV